MGDTEHAATAGAPARRRSRNAVNWKSGWPLVDLATGLTGLALLVVGDLRGHRPVRALGVILIAVAVLAMVAHLWSRRGGKAPPTGTQ